MDLNKYLSHLRKVGDAINDRLKQENVNLFQPSMVEESGEVPDNSSDDKKDTGIRYVHVSSGGSDDGFVSIVDGSLYVLPRFFLSNCTDLKSGATLGDPDSFLINIDTNFRVENITISQDRLIDRLATLKPGEQTTLTPEIQTMLKPMLVDEIIEQRKFTFEQIDEIVDWAEQKAKKLAGQIVKAKMSVKAKANA